MGNAAEDDGEYAGGVRAAPLEQGANAGEVFVVFLQGLGEDQKALAGQAEDGGAADGLKLLCDMLEHCVAALHAVGLVDVAEAVEVDGQDDEGQRQGGHGHDEQLARREPPVFNQHPDVAGQREGQNGLKQKEHVRRDDRADAERVGASGDEPVADELEDDVQQAEDDDIAENAAVQVDDLRFPAADVQQNQRQQQQGAPEKV